MTISEKVAYLKGLAEGLDLDTSKSKEGKLISVMIGILEEIDAISDDLSDVEKAVFEDEDEDDTCGCGCEDEDDDFFEIECPNCKEDLVIDDAVLESGVVQCPNCKEKFALELSDDCGCEDEGCSCHHHDGEDEAE